MKKEKTKQLTDLEIAIKLEEIDREEPKEETLEEAAERYAKQFDYAEDSSPQLDFIEGAKWQAERMYSEEDIRNAFIEGYKQRAEKSNLIFDNASIMYAIHLFEQFKKK